MSGTADGPFEGTAWTLNGGDSADNHHPNASRGTTQSFLTTSSLHKPDEYPQFTSDALASWRHGGRRGVQPAHGRPLPLFRPGRHHLQALDAHHRPHRVGAYRPELSFFTSYDTEPDWDFMFVEAHTVGQDDWTTLPDQNGHTTQNTGESCLGGMAHRSQRRDPSVPRPLPDVERRRTRVRPDRHDRRGGTRATGRSNGWQEWSIDLSAYVGSQVEVSISYVSDWGAQGIGALARRHHRVDRGRHRVVRDRPGRVDRGRAPPAAPSIPTTGPARPMSATRRAPSWR